MSAEPGMMCGIARRVKIPKWMEWEYRADIEFEREAGGCGATFHTRSLVYFGRERMSGLVSAMSAVVAKTARGEIYMAVIMWGGCLVKWHITPRGAYCMDPREFDVDEVSGHCTLRGRHYDCSCHDARREMEHNRLMDLAAKKDFQVCEITERQAKMMAIREANQKKISDQMDWALKEISRAALEAEEEATSDEP